MQNLISAYIEAGIIQFGRFEQPDGSFSPLAMNFLLLPSFPALLRETALALLPLLQQTSADRLLATRASTSLGAVLAVESGLPLTYHYGEMRGVSNAFVIEGAYDIGHPTALLTYTIGNDDEVHALLEPAQKVGLNVVEVLCLFTVGKQGVSTLTAQGIRVQAVFDFRATLETLTLPTPLKTHLHQWLLE